MQPICFEAALKPVKVTESCLTSAMLFAVAARLLSEAPAPRWSLSLREKAAASSSDWSRPKSLSLSLAVLSDTSWFGVLFHRIAPPVQPLLCCGLICSDLLFLFSPHYFFIRSLRPTLLLDFSVHALSVHTACRRERGNDRERGISRRRLGLCSASHSLWQVHSFSSSLLPSYSTQRSMSCPYNTLQSLLQSACSEKSPYCT